MPTGRKIRRLSKSHTSVCFESFWDGIIWYWSTRPCTSSRPQYNNNNNNIDCLPGPPEAPALTVGEMLDLLNSMSQVTQCHLGFYFKFSFLSLSTWATFLNVIKKLVWQEGGRGRQATNKELRWYTATFLLKHPLLCGNCKTSTLPRFGFF